jgi:hypothetical protein
MPRHLDQPLHSSKPSTWKSTVKAALLLISTFLFIGGWGIDRVGARWGLPRVGGEFAERVAPILASHCLSCHGERIQRSGFDARTEESILRGGKRGAVIVPGKPEESLLYRLITHLEEPAMPLGDPLSSEEIATIAEWIRRLDAPVASSGAIPTRTAGYAITPQDRQWWSFVKPVRPPLPSVRETEWVRNGIDSFILHRLEQEGLEPAPPADRRTLLRRVTYDLTGLPPTPEEVAAFLAVPEEKFEPAYEAVIDRLLASPHYGERWGRHWLDLARYADSGGYEFDYDRPHAWHYRDWVIRAFNEDLPYDQFVRAQLANDELHPDDPQALIPTGFCRNGPTVDNVNNEETRSDELDDMVSTTSSVFLGITLGCARCHDHKYDPLPTRDYYRMSAIFAPAAKTEQPLVDEEAVAAHRAVNKVVDEQIKPFRTRLAALEKPFREALLQEKVHFHVRLAERSSGFGTRTREEFRAETLARLSKEIKIQPEEVEERMTPAELVQRRSLQREIDALQATRPAPYPAAMGVKDQAVPGKSYLLLRGDWRTKGEEVQPGLPTVLSNGQDLALTSRRRQLADFIVQPDNPLTARVAVNRIWKHHFGSGLVQTTSDFGLTGDRPSHPALLDWLALEFREQAGWRWKPIHRLMLLSNTYRQSGADQPAAQERDPQNRLRWRMEPRRLEAEAIRDSFLATSGTLNRKMFGPGIYPRIDPDIINTGSRPKWPLNARDDEETFRRSIYIFVKRSVLIPMLEVFDCPVTVISEPSRASSTVSPQALALLNNQFVLEQGRWLAERVAREAGSRSEARIERAFQLALQRPPSSRERRWSEEFLVSQTSGYVARQAKDADRAALRDFCHALFNLNEFLYLD